MKKWYDCLKYEHRDIAFPIVENSVENYTLFKLNFNYFYIVRMLEGSSKTSRERGSSIHALNFGPNIL